MSVIRITSTDGGERVYRIDLSKRHFPATESTDLLKKWESYRFGAFVCFNSNQFSGSEHCKITDPKIYNPQQLDVAGWVAAFKAAGMKYAVLTTKHCIGHCLWPSKHTDWTVAQSPVKDDVVRLFVDACRKHGIKPGFYYLLGWDRHHQPLMTPDEYEQFCRNQITELLTDYGPITELWLDIPFDLGSNSSARLQRIYGRCKKLQPDCLICFNQPMD